MSRPSSVLIAIPIALTGLVLLAAAETFALVGVVRGTLSESARLFVTVTLLLSMVVTVAAIAWPWVGRLQGIWRTTDRVFKFVLVPVYLAIVVFFLVSTAQLIDSVFDDRAFDPALRGATNLDKAHASVREQLRKVNDDRVRLDQTRVAVRADGEVTAEERLRLLDERTLLAMDESMLHYFQALAVEIRVELGLPPLTKKELRGALGTGIEGISQEEIPPERVEELLDQAREELSP